MSDVFRQLRESVERLERDLARTKAGAPPSEEVLRSRAERIARKPAPTQSLSDRSSYLVFERAGRRYAGALDCLLDVASLTPPTPVPGLDEIFLGVTARKGKVIAVIDLPRIFSPGVAVETQPEWLLVASAGQTTCGIACDALHDVVDVAPADLADSMPTFLALAQRHAIGILEDRTVAIDLKSLLVDPALRVEDAR